MSMPRAIEGQLVESLIRLYHDKVERLVLSNMSLSSGISTPNGEVITLKEGML